MEVPALSSKSGKFHFDTELLNCGLRSSEPVGLNLNDFQMEMHSWESRVLRALAAQVPCAAASYKNLTRFAR